MKPPFIFIHKHNSKIINYMEVPSCHPWPLPVRQVPKGVKCNIHVLNNLKIIHAEAYEISSMGECIFEAFFRFNCTGSQHFESNPWFLQSRHETDRLFRIKIEQVIMPFRFCF